MTRMFQLSALLGLISTVPACAEGDEGPTGNTYQALLDAQSALLDAFCECQLGTNDPAALAECRDTYGEESSGVNVACVERNLDRDPAAAELVACQTQVSLDWIACLEAGGSCELDGGAVFTCDDGGEIPQGWVCDDEADCIDGSDEASCEPFQCGDGSEVPASYVCDAEADCADQSDEQGCASTCESEAMVGQLACFENGASVEVDPFDGCYVGG